MAVKKYSSKALAKGTKTTYNQGVKAYKKFESYIQIDKENAFPPDLDKILLFVAYLAYHRKLSYRCIHTYVCSVRNWVMRSGGQDPLQSKKSQCRFKLKQLLAGVKRATRKKRNVKKPLKKRHIIKIVGKLETTRLFDHNSKVMVKAALLLAFFGFFRCSEYTCSSTNQKSFLRRKDVKVKRDKLKITLRKTKTNQFESSVVRIYGNGTDICPVHAMKQYLALSNHSRSSSLFWKDNKPLKSATFNKILRDLLRAIGLNPSHYSSHSLRAGAATTAANRGIPSWLIQRLGRWHSNCYKIYIRNPTKSLKLAQLSMSK